MSDRRPRLYDNTRISAFKRCPRKFLFRHVLHWSSTGKRAPLVFGGAWHSAMEVIWAGLRTEPSEKLANDAYEAFIKTWTDEGFPHPDEMDYEMYQELSPRTPSQAYEMIVGYIEFRKPQAMDFELLAIERPFIVPMDPNDPNLFYVGKIDKIVTWRSKILGIEHKTTTMYKKGGPFRSTFVDAFSPNSQVDGYLYALHLMFPGRVGGVWVDGALVHKSEEGFRFIPVEKQADQLNSWLWDTCYWIERIESEMRHYDDVDPYDKYMTAFPKNTESCQDFNTNCEYIDLCRSWTNVKGRDVPEGFEYNKWDPLKEVKGLEALVNG